MENITRIADLPMDTNARQNTNSYASNIPPTSVSISNSKQNKIKQSKNNFKNMIKTKATSSTSFTSSSSTATTTAATITSSSFTLINLQFD